MHGHLRTATQAVLNARQVAQVKKAAFKGTPHSIDWEADCLCIGLSHQNYRQAQSNWRQLFSFQRSDGSLPGNSYPHSNKTYKQYSTLTSPAVHGFSLELFLKRNTAQKDLAQWLWPKIIAHHQFLYKYRDPDQLGIVLIHYSEESPCPDISNWQNASLTSTEYENSSFVDDPLSASIQIYDPLYNALLIRSNESLLEIGNWLGKDTSEILSWYEHGTFGINDLLWEESSSAYMPFDHLANTRVDWLTLGGILPLLSGVPTQAQAEAMLLTLSGPAFNFGKEETISCPTLDIRKSHPINHENSVGAVRLSLNWLLYQGLLRYAMYDAAEWVRNDSLDLVAQHGYFKYFDHQRNMPGRKGYGLSNDYSTAVFTMDFIHEDPWRAQEEE